MAKENSIEKVYYYLPKDIAEKWVAALRSGQFKQGINYLYKDDKYCCLGVLGCILGAKRDDMLHYAGVRIGSIIKNLPTQLDFKEGDKDDETNKVYMFVRQFTNLNDVDKKSFIEIAQWIEDNVLFIEPEEGDKEGMAELRAFIQRRRKETPLKQKLYFKYLKYKYRFEDWIAKFKR